MTRETQTRRSTKKEWDYDLRNYTQRVQLAVSTDFGADDDAHDTTWIHVASDTAAWMNMGSDFKLTDVLRW